MAASAASSAATALYKYTYTLGRSLYVPITSRCNSIPLPATRGPGFLLPRGVAEALCVYRNAEVPGSVPADVYGNDNSMEDYNEQQQRVHLPPYTMPLVNSLYEFNTNLPEYLQQQGEMKQTNGANQLIDDWIEPSIESLVDEVTTRLELAPRGQYDQVVIAGEGEPTLRMDALLAVAKSVQQSNTNTKNNEQSSSSKKDNNIGVRLITNGLCYGIPNLGYSPQNKLRNGTIMPLHRHVVLRDMMEAGISRVSVALQTANRHEYDVLMEPCCHTGGGGGIGGNVVNDNDDDENSNNSRLLPGTAHDIICEFILEAGKLGMDVEITGIDREEIDKGEAMRLARLLLSVGPRYRQKKMIRWRQYFY